MSEVEQKILKINDDVGSCTFVIDIHKDDTDDWWVTHNNTTGRGHTLMEALEDLHKKLLK